MTMPPAEPETALSRTTVASTNAERSATKLGGLFGMGRSGTSWLGSLIDTHPDVAYRFEPFHRLGKTRSFREVRDRIDAPDFSDADLPRVRDVLLKSHPLTDKPPFFAKSHGRGICRKQFWPVARLVKPLHWFYRAAYTPPKSSHVVFKEVTFAKLLSRFLRQTIMPAVYLARHPCGTVASLLKGQADGRMPTVRLALLDNLTRKHDPALADRLGPGLHLKDPAFQNAILWRIEVEEALRALDETEGGLLIVYENLCREPISHAEATLRHLGLDPSESLALIRESLKSNNSGSGPVSYFSMARNPLHSMEKWKKNLTAAQVDLVLEAVTDSPVFNRLAAIGQW